MFIVPPDNISVEEFLVLGVITILGIVLAFYFWKLSPSNELKTFKDLIFEPHGMCNGLQARIFFPNGYGVSVVRFKMSIGDIYGSYTSNENEWELAVIKGIKGAWEITYDTPVTDDVIGYLTEDEVTKIMIKVQKLK